MKINNELTIEGSCIKKMNEKLNEELKLKQKKGFLNLTLKHKQNKNKNKNWVTSMRRGTNVSKIDQFRSTN